jgi:hypothetical protein
MCGVRSEAECGAAGGTYLGDGTNCGASSCVPLSTGACCVQDQGAGSQCLQLAAADCAILGGNYGGGGSNCQSDFCNGGRPRGRTCSPDFNGDGDNGTDADIEAFFACLAGTCCTACGPADFNGDGDVATDADIESFFRVLAGGGC